MNYNLKTSGYQAMPDLSGLYRQIADAAALSAYKQDISPASHPANPGPTQTADVGTRSSVRPTSSAYTGTSAGEGTSSKQIPWWLRSAGDVAQWLVADDRAMGADQAAQANANAAFHSQMLQNLPAMYGANVAAGSRARGLAALAGR